jgi:peptide/nickel transport system permease protein
MACGALHHGGLDPRLFPAHLWVGLMLIMVFAVELHWLPSNGRGRDDAAVRPHPRVVHVVGWPEAPDPTGHEPCAVQPGLLIRLTRAGTHEALLQDYVKFARAKGLTNSRVIGVHVLRNILIPIVTVIGLQFGALIGFAIVTESVFAWPGMGKLLIDSINFLDRR